MISLLPSQNLLTGEHLGTALGFHCALLYKGVFIPFSYTAQQLKDECSGGLENLWFSLRVSIAPDNHDWIIAGQSSVSNTGCACPCWQRFTEHDYLVNQTTQSRRENTHPISLFFWSPQPCLSSFYWSCPSTGVREAPLHLSPPVPALITHTIHLTLQSSLQGSWLDSKWHLFALEPHCSWLYYLHVL